jgi:hypothetical protein
MSGRPPVSAQQQYCTCYRCQTPHNRHWCSWCGTFQLSTQQHGKSCVPGYVGTFWWIVSWTLMDLNGSFFPFICPLSPHRVQRCGHGRLVPAEILQLLRSLPTHMHERTSMTEQANEVHEIHIVRSDRTFAWFSSQLEALQQLQHLSDKSDVKMENLIATKFESNCLICKGFRRS